ncbi:MAG: dicarboxylate/amino acid:cation symporter [Lachnospiraceae bacterium]|nr:dicarboxylate/amino acid:cation symporter [Lachnospiraceae bacterium]
MLKIELKKDVLEIPRAMEFLDDIFKKRKIKPKNIVRSKLAAEEIIRTMIHHADDDSTITLSVRNLFGEYKLYFRSSGKEFSEEDIEKLMVSTKDDSWDKEANAVIHQMLRKLLANDFSIRNANGINKATLIVHRSSYTNLIITLAAAVLGILTGLIMQFYVPQFISKGITDFLLIPVYTLFMNALKLIVAPLVFCSIASSIADFGNLKALGKIAVRTVIMYIITSFLAIMVGLLTYHIFPIGDTTLAGIVTASGEAVEENHLSVSILDTLIDTVPTNIIAPFNDSNMLQIIFLAVAIGLASSVISEKTTILKELLDALNMALSMITAVIINGIPIIVFCAMAKMMVKMDIMNLMHVIFWVPVIYFGDILMICLYLLLLLILTGLNPLKFLKKYIPAMLNAFTLSSSNAALPASMKQCDELGISKQLYSFTLPLGATINMDGSCITLMITSLFFSKVFGLPVTASVLLSLFISIMVLSVGSPGVPGGVLICITILISQIGIPAEATSLIMGLYPLVSMMQTCTNVTGDAVVSAIVAKKENKLDIAKYNAI